MAEPFSAVKLHITLTASHSRCLIPPESRRSSNSKWATVSNNSSQGKSMAICPVVIGKSFKSSAPWTIRCLSPNWQKWQHCIRMPPGSDWWDGFARCHETFCSIAPHIFSSRDSWEQQLRCSSESIPSVNRCATSGWPNSDVSPAAHREFHGIVHEVSRRTKPTVSALLHSKACLLRCWNSNSHGPHSWMHYPLKGKPWTERRLFWAFLCPKLSYTLCFSHAVENLTRNKFAGGRFSKQIHRMTYRKAYLFVLAFAFWKRPAANSYL